MGKLCFGAAMMVGLLVGTEAWGTKASGLEDRVYGEVDPRVPIPILCYHGITSQDDSLYSVNPDSFEAQLQEIKRLGRNPVTLSRIYRGLSEGKNLPSHPIAITFDDGLKSVWTEAAPILKRYGYPATLYLNTQHMGPARLTWIQIKELAARGWDIGSHGHSHKSMTPRKGKNSPDFRMGVMKELTMSLQALKKVLGKNILFHLAYPYGLYDIELTRQAANAGYVTGVSINGGVNHSKTSPLKLTRILVSQNMSLKRFAEVLSNGIFVLDKSYPADGGVMPLDKPGITFSPSQEIGSSQPYARIQGKNWKVKAVSGGYRAEPLEALGSGAHIAEIGHVRDGRRYVATRLFWVKEKADR